MQPNESGVLFRKKVEKMGRKLRTGFLNWFKADLDRFFLGDTVEWDRVEADRGMATPTTKSGGFETLVDGEFEALDAKAPTYKVQMPFNLKIGEGQRLPGIAATEEVKKQALIESKLYKNIRTLYNRVRRSMMWQASKIFQTGKIPWKSELGAKIDDIDFEYSPELFAAPVVPWVLANGDVNVNADPIKDLEDHIRLLEEKCEVDDFIIVMDSRDAIRGFTENPKVKEWSEQNKLGRGEFEFEDVDEAGFAFRGKFYLAEKNRPIYTFSETYKHPETEQMTPFLDAGAVVILPKSDDFETEYGLNYAGIPKVSELDASLPEEVKGITGGSNISHVGDTVALDFWIETRPVSDKDNDGVFLRLISRPLLTAESKDTHGCLKVKAAA